MRQVTTYFIQLLPTSFNTYWTYPRKLSTAHSTSEHTLRHFYMVSSSCFNSTQSLWGYIKASTDQKGLVWKVWCAKHCQGNTWNKTSKPNHLKTRLPQVKGLQTRRLNGDCKAGQPEEKFKKSHSCNKSTCAMFHHVGFSNTETLLLSTKRTSLQMDFYCLLQENMGCNRVSCCSISIEVAFFSLLWNHCGRLGRGSNLFTLQFKGLAACTWAATTLQLNGD